MLSNIIFTFINLISSILTVLIAFILLIILLIYLQRQQDVSLLLVTNTYAAMIGFPIVVLSANINILKADLYGNTNRIDNESIGCRFQGFLIYETFGCCYMSFVHQAFYRLTRVIYTRHKFLQTFLFNLICIILQWIIYFLFLLPSYFWPGTFYSLYLSDYYCGILYEKLGSLSYTVANIFVLPIVYLTIIYARLLYFIHHQTLQLSQTQRDLAITRRILFTVIALTLPGLPTIGFVFMMSPSVTVFILSISLIFITPEIKEIFIKFLSRRSHVAPATIITMKNLQQQPSVLLPRKNQI